jgi:predicted anti-sigma-YlaC factor YlaD
MKMMKCDKVYPYILSEVSFATVEEHLKECKTCAKKLENIEHVMALLDDPIEVPSGLTEKILQKKNAIKSVAHPIFDIQKYLQIAAVLAAAVFLGVLLGQNANSNLFVSKKQKKDKALIEFRESLLLKNDNSFYKL